MRSAEYGEEQIIDTGENMAVGNTKKLAIVMQAKHGYTETVGTIDYSLPRKIGLEYKCLFAGQEVSLSEDVLAKIMKPTYGMSHSRAWVIPATAGGIKAAWRKLVRAVEQGGSAMIPVVKVGAGPSEKSCKVRVAGVSYDICDYNGAPIKPSTHTLTVPASWLVEENGHHYVARWRLNRTIHEHILARKSWPTDIEGGVWLAAPAIWSDLFEPLITEAERVQAAEKAAEAERLKRREQHERELSEIAAKAAIEREQKEALEREEKARKAAQHEKRMAALETLAVKSVDWMETVQEKDKYGNKTYTKIPVRVENCTLKFSGKRVYIIQPDGTETIKARDSVTWQV